MQKPTDLELHHLSLAALGSDLDMDARRRYFRASLQLLRLLRDDGCTPAEFELLVSEKSAALRAKLVGDVRLLTNSAISAYAEGTLSFGG